MLPLEGAGPAPALVPPPAVPDVSVVIPCRNEEANVDGIVAAVTAELERAAVSFEVILIDNDSADTTVARAKAICARDRRVRLIVNARNFGQMRSPTHGIFQASGRAVIAMCADFQDPPDLIGPFIARWRAGIPIVLGVRNTEPTSAGLGLARNFAYGFARRFADYPVIRNATGFGLYDRRVVDAIARLAEPEPFFRGMLVETGFAIEQIAYDRPQRAAGKSNNGVLALVDFALSSLAGSSKRLLRAPLYAAVLAGVLAVACVAIAPLSGLLGFGWLGWLIAAAVEANFAVAFAGIGLIGDQVRLIAERTRGTPLVIEKERVNFPA